MADERNSIAQSAPPDLATAAAIPRPGAPRDSAGARLPSIRDSALGRAIALAATAAYWVIFLRPTPYNAPSLQAAAMLHGHLWIVAPGNWIEHVSVGGHDYILHPPLASLLMVPFVALFGPGLPQPYVGLAVGLAIVAAGWSLIAKLCPDERARPWLGALWAAGTIVMSCATLASSWNFALLCGVLPTALALNETFGRGRPWLVGLWAGLAVMGRYDYILALPLYPALLGLREWRRLTAFAIAPAICGALIVVHNYLCFGTISDPTQWMWAAKDIWLAREGGGSPFQLKFIPFNLYTLLFMAPNFTPRPPWIEPTMMGQALIFTSPAFYCALAGRLDRAAALLWAMALAVMIPSLIHYANGFDQFGVRFWIMAYPCFLALLCRARFDSLTRAAIIASIVLVGLGTWQAHAAGF